MLAHYQSLLPLFCQSSLSPQAHTLHWTCKLSMKSSLPLSRGVPWFSLSALPTEATSIHGRDHWMPCMTPLDCEAGMVEDWKPLYDLWLLSPVFQHAMHHRNLLAKDTAGHVHESRQQDKEAACTAVHCGHPCKVHSRCNRASLPPQAPVCC